MGRHFTHTMTKGFTIIETMLVLAITGVLIAGLLVGLGSSISAQRYKDSVSTLKADLQSQYNQVANVTSNRESSDSSWKCGPSATPTQGGAGKLPGQSECVVLGRYVAIDKTEITTATVVGYKSPGTAGANDVETMKDNYTFGIAKDTITVSSLEWGAQIAWPEKGTGKRKPTTPRSIAILIVRSPDSGTTYTFTSDSVTVADSISSATLTTMMVADPNVVPGQGGRTICIDPNDGALGVPSSVPEKLAIYIGRAANGPSSIESRSFATITALGGDTQC